MISRKSIFRSQEVIGRGLCQMVGKELQSEMLGTELELLSDSDLLADKNYEPSEHSLFSI